MHFTWNHCSINYFLLCMECYIHYDQPINSGNSNNTYIVGSDLLEIYDWRYRSCLLLLLHMSLGMLGCRYTRNAVVANSQLSTVNCSLFLQISSVQPVADSPGLTRITGKLQFYLVCSSEIGTCLPVIICMIFSPCDNERAVVFDFPNWECTGVFHLK